MSFHIRRLGEAFAVYDGGGACLSGALSLEDAQAQVAVLVASERERSAIDPDQVKRRQTKAAYRQVAKDPYLTMLKNFLPRKGEIERTTQHSYDQMMQGKAPPELEAINEQRIKEGLEPHPVFSFEKCMSIAASDARSEVKPTVHSELNKTAGQRQVTKAAQVNEQRGDAMRAQIAERWNALVDVPERKRAAFIAHELSIDVRHVRRLRPR